MPLEWAGTISEPSIRGAGDRLLASETPLLDSRALDRRTRAGDRLLESATLVLGSRTLDRRTRAGDRRLESETLPLGPRTTSSGRMAELGTDIVGDLRYS